MKVDRRRRRENKTNYLKRIKLLKSNIPRLTVRKTNKYIIAQYIKSKEAQDKIIFGINSKKLLNYGWPKELQGSLKSIPASYLLGFLVGKNIIDKNLEAPILDFGLQRVIKGTKIHGFIKGLVDSGVDIKYKESFFPDEKIIEGINLKEKIQIDKIKEKIENGTKKTK